MNYLIKIIFFKILLIIFFTTHLNGKPIILVQTDSESVSINIQSEIPILVLGKIKVQFAELNLNGDSFLADPQWGRIKDWKNEPPQLYMLNLKMIEKPSTMLTLELFQYKLKSKQKKKLTLKEATNFMDSNYRVNPIVLKFYFNQKMTKVVKKKVNQSLKDIQSPTKDLRKAKMMEAELYIQGCGDIYDDIAFNITMIASLLSTTDNPKFNEFNSNLNENQKAINSKTNELNMCIRGLNTYQEDIGKYNITNNEASLLMSKTKVLRQMESLNNRISRNIKYWPTFNLQIDDLLENARKKIELKQKKKISDTDVIDKKMMRELKKGSAELFLNFPDILQENRKENKSSKETKKTSSNNSMDQTSLKEVIPLSLNLPPPVSEIDLSSFTSQIESEGNPIKKDRGLSKRRQGRFSKGFTNTKEESLKFPKKSQDNIYDLRNKCAFTIEKLKTLKIDIYIYIEDIKLDNKKYSEIFDTFQQSKKKIQKYREDLDEFAEELKKHKSDDELIIHILIEADIISLLPWKVFLSLIEHLIELMHPNIILKNSQIITEKKVEINKFFKTHMGVHLVVPKLKEEEKQEGAWGGTPLEATSEEPLERKWINSIKLSFKILHKNLN